MANQELKLLKINNVDYELIPKKASSSEFGGIKADARDTQVDVQPAKIGTDGKLYVAEPVQEVDVLPPVDFANPNVIYAVGVGDDTAFYIRKNDIPLTITNKKSGANQTTSFKYTFRNNVKPQSVSYNGETTSDNDRGISKSIGGWGDISVFPDGRVNFSEGSGSVKGTYEGIETITFEKDGKTDTDTFGATINYRSCVIKGSKVKLSNGKYKNIEDVNYNDELACWDFETGKVSYAKPVWIMKAKKANQFNKLTFENGAELYTVNQHRIFNKEQGKFTYPMTEDTPIGTNTLDSNGKYIKLVGKEIVTQENEYYNIMTNKNINLFVNDILTSSRLSNMYPIKELKYVKENASPRNTEDLSSLPQKYIDGLCLREQPNWSEISNNSVDFGKSLVEYVEHLINEEANL